jgi:hypothetical protein
LSSSNTSLPTTLAARPQSLPGPEHLLPLTMNAVTTINNTAALTLCNLDTKPSGTPDNQIREDFAILAKDSKLSYCLFKMLMYIRVRPFITLVQMALEIVLSN